MPDCAATLPLDTDGNAELVLARGATGTYWTVELTTNEPTNRDFGVTLGLGGEDLNFRATHELGAYQALTRLFLLGDRALNLIDDLVRAETLAITFTTSTAEPQSVEVALNGLAEALVHIDTIQGRLGAERVAGAAPEGLTPVSPGFEAEAPPFLLAAHAQSGNCENFTDLPHGDRFIIGELDGGDTLYLVPCYAGAYNYAYLAYLSTADETLAPLPFAYFNAELGWQADTVLINPEWDGATQMLKTYDMGRGTGDCGTRGAWRWTGRHFRMLGFSAKPDCDYEGEPGQFPLVYLAPDQPESLFTE